MPKRRTDESCGFSLVELIFSIVLLSVGLLAVGSFLLAAMEHSKQGRHDMIALNTAGEVLERMRAVPYDDVYALFNGVDTQDSASVPAEAHDWAEHLQEELGPTGRAQINIYKSGEKPDLTTGLMEVEILTSWIERGRQRTMTTSTYLVRMGS